MSKVFFVRDGRGDHKTSQGLELPFATVCDKLANRATKRFETSSPVINPEAGEANAFAGYKHVVVETFEGETSSEFPKPGLYYIMGMSPEEGAELLGVSPR